MIDENLLHERLTAAAAAQDDLLPRALDEDLAGGRRRLRRRQLLTGGGATAAVAVVAVLAVGMNGWLSTNASPTPDKAPVAGKTSALPTAPDPSAAPSYEPISDIPVPADQEPPGPAQDEAFNQRLTAAIYAHLDPGKKHLTFEGGGFDIDRQGGHINSGGARIGWLMPGQKGEGFIGLSVQPKTRAQKPCGSVSEPRMTCHPVKLPNGRTAQLGRKGESAVVQYQQPDGEWINADVSLLYWNNTDIPVHDVGITDQMLLDLVQDDRLTLPTKEEDAAAPRDRPTEAQVRAAAAEALPGGTLTVGFPNWLELPGSQQYGLNWRKGAVSATANYSLYKQARFECPSELGLPKCTPVASPGGGKLQYGEGVVTTKGKKTFVMGGTYVQPDGDGLSFKVTFPGGSRPAGAPTKEDILKFFSAAHIKK